MTEMLPERLLLRGKSYYFRVAVPKDLRAVFGKREVKVSLGTSDCNEAKRLVRQMSADFDRQVDAFRAVLQSPTQLTDLTPDQVRSMVDTWRDGEIDAARSSEIPADPIEATREIERDISSMEAFDLDARTSVSDRAVRILLENGIKLEPRALSRRSAEVTSMPYRVPKPAVESDQFTILVKAIRTAISDILMVERNEALGYSSNATSSSTPPALQGIAPVTTGYPDITLAELKEHFDKSEKRAARLEEGTKDKHGVAWVVLKSVLGSDRIVSSLVRRDFEAVFDVVRAMPPKIDTKFPGVPLLKAVETAKRRGMAPIGPRTINGYMNAIGTLMKHAVQNEMRGPIDIADLKVTVTNWKKDKRLPFTQDQLTSIFSSYAFKPDAPRPSTHKAYDLVPRDSYRFWLPLISLLSGMRVGEIAQLLVEDVVVIGETLCMQVQLHEKHPDPKYYKRLKNASAERTVPVHPELLSMGFADFVERRRALRAIRLFPDAKQESDLTYSQVPSQRLNRFLAKVINKTSQNTVHGFRHKFRDATREAHLSEDTTASILGWRRSNNMAAHYGAGLKASSLFSEIAKVRYEGLDLSHLYKPQRSDL